MRPIKFRVSNGTKTIGYEMLLDGRWFASADGTNWSDCTYTDYRLKRWQFSGLTAIHGTDIYEGDLIRFGHARENFVPLEAPETIAPVTYTYGSFNVAGNTLGEVTDWHECEVIGNVYETSELLEKAA